MKSKLSGLLVVVLLLVMSATGCASAAVPAKERNDEPYDLFDSAYVHRIDVRIAEADWDDLLANPLDKTKYKVDVEIDGQLVESVSFSTKGNSSLAFVAAEGDSTRYSFRINFGKYVDGQTFHGLNKLSLNNNYADATYMRDYFSYELFRQVDVPAPLTSYVWLTINGRDQGLYLAVEDLGKSFLARVYDGKGVIYKPESSDLGLTIEKAEAILANGLPMSSDIHGADLVYKDDNPDSYPDIFENAETKATKKDNQAVVTALKHLSEQTELETWLDTGEIISFFAAHNFVLNYDSYTGGMLHNLVLYADNGRLALLPWDYNLAFGTFVSAIDKSVLTDVTDLLNQGIDTPLIGTDVDSRPMWKWIVDDEQYLNEYHQVLDSLLARYFESGRFEEESAALFEMLLPYVEKDPTAFYSAEEYKNAFEMFREFCMRRAESVRKQLDGDMPQSSEDQQDQDKVKASHISIRQMGTVDF